MGHTIWVDVQGRPEGEACEDNSTMLRLQEPLDELCTRLGLPKLSTFYDYSELQEMYGDSDDEDDAEALEPTWYDPAPALSVIDKLRAYLVEHPEVPNSGSDSPQAHWPSGLLDELAHCQSILQSAASQGKQFRFLIVP